MKNLAELDTTGEKPTARLLKEMLNSLMEGLVFTSETMEDFPMQWGLPTLDTQWRLVVDGG